MSQSRTTVLGLAFVAFVCLATWFGIDYACDSMEANRDSAKQAAIEAAEEDRQENYVKVILRNPDEAEVFGWHSPQAYNDARKQQTSPFSTVEEKFDAMNTAHAKTYKDGKYMWLSFHNGSEVYCHREFLTSQGDFVQIDTGMGTPKCWVLKEHVERAAEDEKP